MWNLNMRVNQWVGFAIITMLLLRSSTLLVAATKQMHAILLSSGDDMQSGLPVARIIGASS
jgi:hypothetical protein